MTDRKNTEKRTYVLDTNVLLHDPTCIREFKEHDVVVPLGCVEELEDFKKEYSDRGVSARQAVRELEKFRKAAKESGKSLREGVLIGDGMGMLKVYSERITKSELGIPLSGRSAIDNSCIEITKRLDTPGQQAVLVTKDINVRIKADAVGVPCEDYEHDKKGYSLNSLFDQGGVKEVFVPASFINEFYQTNQYAPITCPADIGGIINQALVLKADDCSNGSALARNAGDGRVRKIQYKKTQRVISISARNTEQQFTLDALLDERTRVCVILGKAGTGKTILALAAGLHLVNDLKYSKMVVVRPTTIIGEGLGFLPGSLAEKEHPFMMPIIDNLQILLDYDKNPERWAEESWRKQVDRGTLELETPMYLRGRSLSKTYIVIDEAQNLPYHVIRTAVTRVAEETKIIFVGDPWQIDSPYLDEESNGLTTLARRIMGKRGYIVTDFLTKGERDPQLTDDLSELLY